jgi:virginiamycin B lyase
METCTMFLRFTPLSAIRDFRRRACQVRRLRPGPRPGARTRRQFRLEGLEERCLLSGVSAITESTVSGGFLGNSPEGITTGPDNNLWYTEYSGNAIGTFNPTTGASKELALPAGSDPRGITAGPEGSLWFTEIGTDKIGMINPTTDAITQIAVPTSSSGPQDITVGPDGNLWFTEYNANKIGMYNWTTRAFTEFKVPTKNSYPSGITTADGNLWFTENSANKIGMITPTGKITEYSIPEGSEPQEIAAAPNGNLWFGLDSFIGEITPSGSFSEFAVTNGPEGITAGPDGNVWFAEGYAVHPEIIASINPTTDALTEYPASSPVYHPYAITTGPDGNLWFTDVRGASSIGVATLSSSELVVTQPPPSTIASGSSFGLTVQAEDSSGNPITSFNGTVTVGLGTNTNNNNAGVTLGGTLTVTASNGVATFTGLTLPTNAGYYYTLYVSGGGFGWGVTGTITVTAAAATQSAIVQQPPAAAPDPLLGPLVLDSPDIWDGLLVKKRSTST